MVHRRVDRIDDLLDSEKQLAYLWIWYLKCIYIYMYIHIHTVYICFCSYYKSIQIYESMYCLNELGHEWGLGSCDMKPGNRDGWTVGCLAHFWNVSFLLLQHHTGILSPHSFFRMDTVMWITTTHFGPLRQCLVWVYIIAILQGWWLPFFQVPIISRIIRLFLLDFFK